MKFEYGGKLHRFAYNWNSDRQNEELPAQTSICKLFWLSVFALLVGWPSHHGAVLFGWAVRIVLLIPAFVLFGARPAGPSWNWRGEKNEHPFPFVPVKWWPRVWGVHFMPGMYLLILLFVGIVGYAAWIFFVEFLLEGVFLSTLAGRISLGVILTVAAVATIYSVSKNTETWRMAKAFVKAKKERFCPTVEFV